MHGQGQPGMQPPGGDMNDKADRDLGSLAQVISRARELTGGRARELRWRGELAISAREINSRAEHTS